jgi:O-antigen/teichoic acid export membrane protein
VAFILAAILVGFSNILADELLNEPAVSPILRWISICIPLTAIGRILLATTRAFKRMQYHAYADSVLFNVVKLALTLLLLGMGLGVQGVLAAHVIAWIVEDALLFFYVNRLFSLKRPLREARRNFRQLLEFSIPMGLTEVARMLRGNFEVLLLGGLSTMTTVGLYSAALRVQMVGGMFLLVADLTARPIISELYHRGEMDQLGQLYRTLTRWSVTFFLPYFLTIVLFAEPILSIFGQEFVAGVPVLILISMGTLVNAATGVCSAMIAMSGHSRLTLMNTMVAVSLSLIVSILLIPTWGIIGAAVAAASSLAVVSGLRLLQIYRLLSLWPYDREFVKPLLATAVALCIGLAARYLVPVESIPELFLDIGVLWIGYVGAVLLLGLSTEDRAVLARTRGRFSSVLGLH